MYDSKEKVFRCNHCKKKVGAGETCWTKWQLPPDVNSVQDKSIKALEYQNAPIICLECAGKIITINY